MRDYGKVHTSFWSSATIGSMSEDARTLALYLLTSPHTTIAGVMRLPDGYVCEDLRWVPERVSKGFTELFRKGFANRCETTKWVWICKHFDWNQPENPNQRKAAAKVALSVPDECSWKPDFIRVCGPILGIEAGPSPNRSETVPEPFRNQKQEQKQEQKQKTALAPEQTEPGFEEPAPAAKPAAHRGSRLPPDWTLTKVLAAEGQAARKTAGLPLLTDVELRAEGAKFRDYWLAKSGKDATKIDWTATWRNWCRSARGSGAGSFAAASTPPPDRETRMEEITV